MRASRVIFSLLVFAGVFLVGAGASAGADSSAEAQSSAAGSNARPDASVQTGTPGKTDPAPPNMPPVLSGAPVPAFYTGTITEVHDAHPPDPALLCSTPPKAETRVEMEAVGDARGFDAGYYLENRVLPMVRANWYRLAAKSVGKNAGQVTVEFEVRKDGTIGATKLTDASSDSSLSQMAVTAIEKSTPFSVLPADFTGPSINLRGVFSYRPDPTGRSIPVTTSSTVSSTARQPAFLRSCNAAEAAKAGQSCLAPPRVIYQTDPEFTPEARRAKYQGTEVLSVVVGIDGSVQSACVLQPLGYGLDAMGIDAVRKWKFEPATLNRKPQASQIAVEIDFHLDKDEDTSVAAPNKP
jgi:TonB family protein